MKLIASGKRLPSFSGDSLDGVRYKEDYEHSTRIGEYTDEENVTRLYDSLKGEARNTVRSLFAGQKSARNIMESLKARFGNPQMILLNLVSDIKDLPRVDPYKITFVDFAVNLKNAVQTISVLDDTSYLYNNELVSDLLRKLPSSILSLYANYVQLN